MKQSRWLQICFALVYLFLTLGYSASPGVVIMILFVPINIIGSIIIKKWQVFNNQVLFGSQRVVVDASNEVER